MLDSRAGQGGRRSHLHVYTKRGRPIFHLAHLRLKSATFTRQLSSSKRLGLCGQGVAGTAWQAQLGSTC